MFNLDFSGDRPPLYDWLTRTVWPKNIKFENTVETDNYILDAPELSQNIAKINLKVNYPFNAREERVCMEYSAFFI